MHQFSAVRFVAPNEQGKPVYFAPGLAVIAGIARRPGRYRGIDIRLQIVAHGPIAAAAHAVINAEIGRTSPPALDTSG